jgi:hypothetical protein
MQSLVRKSEGKRPLGRFGRRLESNIEISLKEIRWDVFDWINPAQERNVWRSGVKTVMTLCVS